MEQCSEWGWLRRCSRVETDFSASLGGKSAIQKTGLKIFMKTNSLCPLRPFAAKSFVLCTLLRPIRISFGLLEHGATFLACRFFQVQRWIAVRQARAARQ